MRTQTPTLRDNPNFWSADTEKAKRMSRKSARAATEAINNSMRSDSVDESSPRRKYIRRKKRSFTITASSKRKYRIVDYIWPKDNPHGTNPTNEIDADLNMRKAELTEIYKAIKLLNSSEGEILSQMNLLKKVQPAHQVAASTELTGEMGRSYTNNSFSRSQKSTYSNV